MRARVRGSVSARRQDLHGRPIVLFRVDPAHRKGALSGRDGETIAQAARLALATRVPLVGLIASSGADVHDGVSALHGWGRAARAIVECSGIVPVGLVVSGPAVSGPALLLGLADLVAMTEDAYAYVSGPSMVEAMTGVALDAHDLGGASVHARFTGVAAFVGEDEQAALDALSLALAHLPSHNDEDPPLLATGDPVSRGIPELRDFLPRSATGSYDVRELVSDVVDDKELVEVRSRWAPNMVTAFATMAGRPVGIVANQPESVAGTLDIAGSQKAARFVRLCDTFNVPLLTFVDTPGFFPGKDLEWRGMIRHGAQLAYAYAEATVPRVCIVTRKAYGGAYIVMDCKSMGNDVCLAWPTAEIAVMGAKGAVQILHRREDEARRGELERQYELEKLNPYSAAERGYVDMVIDPADTRRMIADALEILCTKRERLVARSHSNNPL